ncbi:D-alanyl-lipoteichoic acid biosynthesis protein DltB [Liquorilactobacillus satsumensis]|uniref:Teichoic acid D-alanyltransferase n=1 Tax=Liquorilactobacillus satsumensis DSM 16230 = JCM 12392 TaxID=1423801 RepID=A0A0R1UWS4_9LACO|nr:D-alanyl-lipoteichoic acid biosynthesis protein DltB [Liquorilactobacillus satsumensis]KRL97486.1 protein dltB [Liquorilactobacillus satsumensis DSM 16230 = JCM 12392]MCP9312632.1 D-alanyl-lipoteichoic acid biosynthesis protein DltB [Liquorilactobacillus satsumensis]MCP9327589.1 D-alanyl-lipoteichoic acid biosynthesis protein DltB [Liquorilactobacillus satsumensis]MCP9357625.1 D-alanyl-lipoteichoic acid biosynthesis protein DltB [Liquorilactobacillus satsumensis]MCP9359818.1 D-alanyl-lipote
MINLQPYENPMYFVYLVIALLPIMIAMLRGKQLHWYQTIVSFAFLLLAFGGVKWHEGIALIGYIIFEVVLVGAYFHYRQRENQTWIFCSAVILAIIPLVIVKVTPAVYGHPSLIGFLGISYLTFKAVQMVMEIRDGAIKEFDPWLTLQFLLFFPTISSGPIDRYRRFKADYERVPNPQKYLQLLDKAVWYIFLGFLYKFLLAYVFGTLMLPYVSKMALSYGGISWWLVAYMYVYSMDLFFDFAGYSLFAVGISYLMGIETPMNFNRPFSAVNIKEFWNRWHMTLSFWFRDYIYMRLVFFIMKKKLMKNRIAIANVGYLTLFLIMGFWHGLTWYYIVYGLYHALAIILCDVWLRYKKKHKDKFPSNRFTKLLAIFITFNVVCFSFLIFSGFLDKLLFHNIILR